MNRVGFLNHFQLVLVWLLLAPFMLGGLLLAQQPSSYYDRKNAVDQADSRAEREAEQMVSLAPDTIIAILRKETGLMLQVKKALVRAAYSQGRLLDPKELSDDSLFRLIRDDDNVRVIATQEITNRDYVRAKPTQAELRRTPPCAPISDKDVSKPPADPNTNHTQEQAYWFQHDGDLDCYYYQNAPNAGAMAAAAAAAQGSGSPASSTAPQYTLPPPYQSPQFSPDEPQGTDPYDPRRQLLAAQMRQRSYFENSQTTGEMSPISPDQLPGVLNTSAGGDASSSLAKGMASGAPGTGGLSGEGSNADAASLSSLMMQSGQTGSNTFQQQASVENQLRPPLPPYYFPRNPEQPALRHRPNPYADVPSLYDLYAQYQKRSPTLQRFGADIFLNGTGNIDQLPMDLPAGPDYVVGPGDGLVIQLTGAVSRQLKVMVDRSGRVALPEVGAVEVSGRSLGEVQRIVQSNLRSQYRDIDADVSLGRLRTLRVYLVGDVERPGAYDVSSLSTPLNVLYTAGGPTSSGSLRLLQHYRGSRLLQEVDSYDLLLHGIRGDVLRLEAGDTVRIPPVGPEVTIEGMVRRPAIYELHGEKTLAEVLELAGGVLPSGTFRHVDVERLQAHESRTMLRVDIPETNNESSVRAALDNFQIQDGDKVKISPILPFPDKTVYLDGHVSRPGKFAYQDGMKVTDLIKSYKDLLPEPYQTHAEVIRLQPPDYAPQIISFNLGEAMSGNDQDIVLKPFDTVRVFGRFDFEDQPIVTVTGEVRDPGDHVTNGSTTLRDAIYLAGGATSNALLTDAQVFRKTADGKIEVVSVNLAKALSGDPTQNILLGSKDRIFVQKNLNHTDPAMVTITGEVGQPGKYPLGADMTAATLVRLAGGLTRGAYTKDADLTRYEIEQGTKMVSERMDVPIADALANVADADVRLRDGDVLAIRQLPGWKDLGSTIELAGEVVHPGTYGIQEGERLSSVIQRAGGFRTDAYPYGAVFQRAEVQKLEEKNRANLIQSAQSQSVDIKLSADRAGDDPLTKAAALQQYEATLQSLQNTAPEGRLVIHISSKLQRWANTSADIQVRNGDRVYVPKRPSVVLVDGSVYNPTGITYRPGHNTKWYLMQAGGPTNMADKKAAFVIRADGSVAGGKGGLFSGGYDNAALQPGDMVVVPEKIYSNSHLWQNTVQAAQVMASIAIAVSYARTF